MVVVTPTDRPKSVCNRCLIEVFGGFFVLSRCFYDFSVDVGAFVTGLSQTSSFFSYGQAMEKFAYCSCNLAITIVNEMMKQ